MPNNKLERARWMLQSRHQLCVWSCDTLSEICVASLAEDKYGILQVRISPLLRESLVAMGHTDTDRAMHAYACCALVPRPSFTHDFPALPAPKLSLPP